MVGRQDDGSLDETRDPRIAAGDATAHTGQSTSNAAYSTADATHVQTAYRTENAHYRRPLLAAPVPWLVGLIGIPLILSLAGGLGGKPAATSATPSTPPASVAPAATPTGSVTPHASASSPAPTAAPTTATTGAPSTTPTAAPTSAAPAKPAVFEVSQDGKNVTLSGTVADAATKAGIVDAFKQAYGTGATVVDKLTVAAGGTQLDAASLAGLGGALKGISGITFDVANNTATISGVAADAAAKKAAVDSIAKAFPGAKVDGTGIVVGDPNKAPATCAVTDEYVKVVTAATKIQFATGGSVLTADSSAALTKIADAVKKCPAIKLTVAGNTDNTGNENYNQTLSLRRAESVKAALVQQGVPAAGITTVGNGSAKPIASNDTADGRAKNRRVDITAA